MDARHSLGVYVIGSLPMYEAVEVREHLGLCPECRTEYDELAGLPAMLGMISEQEATFGPVQANDAMLDRLLAQVSAERRRQRGRHRILAAAAAAVILVGGGVAVSTLPGLQNKTSAPVTISATGNRIPVHATILYWPNDKGTGTSLRLSEVPAGTRCSLVIVGKDGQRRRASNWQSSGGVAEVSTQLPMSPGSISRFEVVDQRDRPLVVLKTT